MRVSEDLLDSASQIHSLSKSQLSEPKVSQVFGMTRLQLPDISLKVALVADAAVLV